MTRSQIVRPARRALFRLLRRAGLFERAADSAWRRARLQILCYHGIAIADEHEWNNQLYMSPAMFRDRLDVLRRGRYTVLPLGEALERLRQKTLPPRSVALTFDDGEYGFYRHVVPLLRGYGYPATLYLTTYYCHYQRPVFDTGVAYVLWKSSRPAVDLGRLISGAPWLPLGTYAERRAAGLWIRDRANRSGLSGVAKDDLLHAIAREVGVDYDATFSSRLLTLVTPDEVRQVSGADVDVQLHTHRHRTPDDCGAFVKEIDDNRASIEAILGPGSRTHFCYPSGVYRASFLPWLRRAAVASATTCDFGLATSEDEPLLLPRLVDTGNISSLEFEAWLTGTAALLPHRRPSLAPRGRI